MNTRNLTNVMLIILGLLIVAIILSFVYNDNVNEEVTNDIYDEEQILGDAVNPDEIVINDFTNLFHYFGSFEDGVKARTLIQSELSRYGTIVKNFMVENELFENDTLTFSIVSLENDEEYKVTVTNNEMTLTRIK